MDESNTPKGRERTGDAKDEENSTSSAAFAGRMLFNSIIEAIVMIDQKGVIMAHNDKFKSDFPGVNTGDSIEDIMFFEQTRRHHKGYLSSFLVTGCPQIIGRQRFVTSNRRGTATPTKLGVFPAEDHFVGLLVPIPDEELWIVFKDDIIISASQATTMVLGEPPNGAPFSSVVVSPEGFEGLEVYSLVRRGIPMRHCLVEPQILDNGAMCWTMTDITKIVRNKRLALNTIEKEHSNANLDQLRSFTFHEINNQLLSMRVALHKQDLGRAESVLSYIEESTRTIMGFATDGHHSECCLDKVIREIVTLVRSLLNPGVDMEVDCPSDMFFYGEVATMKVYLMNLLGNASKATMVGKITITVSESKSLLSLIVADTGPGLPQAQINTLTGSNSHADQGPIGHGQGALIIRSCADRLGGKIRVNASPKGSTIRLDFRSAQLPTQEREFWMPSAADYPEPDDADFPVSGMETPRNNTRTPAKCPMGFGADRPAGPLLGQPDENAPPLRTQPSRPPQETPPQDGLPKDGAKDVAPMDNPTPFQEHPSAAHSAEVHCILDDNNDSCELLTILIQKVYPGARVVCVNTPEEWDALRLGEFDVLYVDYNLGHSRTGADLITSARKDGHKMPIAGITGNCNPGDYEYEMMTRAGASDIVGKPFPKPPELKARLEKMKQNPVPKQDQAPAVSKQMLALRRRNRRTKDLSSDAREAQDFHSRSKGLTMMDAPFSPQAHLETAPQKVVSTPATQEPAAVTSSEGWVDPTGTVPARIEKPATMAATTAEEPAATMAVTAIKDPSSEKPVTPAAPEEPAAKGDLGPVEADSAKADPTSEEAGAHGMNSPAGANGVNSTAGEEMSNAEPSLKESPHASAPSIEDIQALKKTMKKKKKKGKSPGSGGQDCDSN